MSAMTFDTLKVAESLKTAGIDEAHARAIVTAMRQAINENSATKADLAVVKSELKADIAALKWIASFQSAFILAIAARLFGLV